MVATTPLSREAETISETRWRAITLATSVSILVLTLYCFIVNITTVFPNLYYFPVIFLAYRYQKRGIFYSVLLGLGYLAMAVYFQISNGLELVGAVLRFVSFAAVAVVIAYLSIGVEKKQLAYRVVSEFNESIVSNANVWLTVLDGTGTIIVWNHAAEDISGYRAEEVIGGNTIWKLMYPEADYRKKITGIIRAIIHERRIFENFETTVRAKNGEKKIISWNTRTIPDEEGNHNRFVAIGIDITERQRAVNALAESELRFRRTFETAKDGLLLLDKESGTVTKVNPAIADMLGFPADELVGKTLEEIGLLRVNGGYGKIHDMLDEYGFVFFSDIEVESRDGKRLDTEVYLVDRATQVQCNVRDITGRKQTERELFRRNEELHTANEQLALAEEELRHQYDELFRSQKALEMAGKKLTLLNSITFTDIQNAVFSLSGYIELAKQAPEGEKAGLIGKQATLVHSISESLRFAGQYQNLGLKPPAWQNVMQAFLYGVSHLDLQGFLRTLDVEGLEIYGDPLLENVFYTLAENVAVHGKKATRITLRYEKTKEGLTLFFEDDGQGIPAGSKENIFDRRFEENRGMGLFLSREILSITGITISETGEPGKGARFEIRVPEGGYRFQFP